MCLYKDQPIKTGSFYCPICKNKLYDIYDIKHIKNPYRYSKLVASYMGDYYYARNHMENCGK